MNERKHILDFERIELMHTKKEPALFTIFHYSNGQTT